MTIPEKTALKNFLKKKLEVLKASEKTQITLIVLWLVEIYENKVFYVFGFNTNSIYVKA